MRKSKPHPSPREHRLGGCVVTGIRTGNLSVTGQTLYCCATQQPEAHEVTTVLIPLHLRVSVFLFSLQDQNDVIEKHTQSGLELVEKYIKFVKERTEIEQSYAKQIR